jgi:hypothetical protein
MKPHLPYAQRTITIEEAWRNLAADVLIFAISDVRQKRDPKKRKKAKEWLLSPAAALFFDEIINPQFDVPTWVKADCPMLKSEGNQNGRNNSKTVHC